MRLPEDTICKVCQSVFCCAKCCRKHQLKAHAIIVHQPIMISTNISTTSTTSTASIPSVVKHDDQRVDQELRQQEAYEDIYLFCPICEKRPLPLHNDIYAEMLIHLETHHLPLRCDKCGKLYYNIDDLKEFTKCMRPFQVCQSQESMSSNQSCKTEDASKVTVTRAMPSIQDSPMHRQDFNDSHMTPISIINMRWKAKSSKAIHDEFISDSVSSIKNISSISNSSIRRSIGVASTVQGKVIRSTSTPVHLEMVFSKPKEQTFNATGGGHMSSIYNSGCESDISPALPLQTSQALEPMNRYRKVGGGRSKMSAVTPLRHVMSKSIQKAFAEHGLPAASTAVRGTSAALQRKKMFDTTSSPSLDGGAITHHLSPGPPALDLRLSPAVRRSQSESEESLQLQISNDQQRLQRNDLPNMRRKILLSAQKLTTESIVITHTEHLASVSSSSSAISSHGSINSILPHTSTNSSYQSAASGSSGGSVFKSCSSSVEIITAEIKQIQAIEATSGISNALPPITPITRIPGAVIHKKLIKFETPKIESSASKESQNSPNDVFFTPNATPMRKSSLTLGRDGSSADVRSRNRLVPQNLNGRFSSPRKPSIKECAHSTAFSRIENITDTFDANDYYEDIDDDVFTAEEPEKIAGNSEEPKPKQNQTQSNGLWSIMSSVMRLPSRKGSNPKLSPKNESSIWTDVNSKSIIKRCASIAGSLVRTKPLVNENELNTLKRKRTFTVSDQSALAHLSQFNNTEATSPTSESNTSSKRFRIQGRRPIDRMRLNS